MTDLVRILDMDTRLNGPATMLMELKGFLLILIKNDRKNIKLV